MATKYINVRWLKAHWAYAYSAGQNGIVDANVAPVLLKGGFILPLPDEDDGSKPNPLPADFPAKDKLFDNGFDTVEKVQQAGPGLQDIGISKAMIKKILAYGK
jgi:hypothetical protein